MLSMMTDGEWDAELDAMPGRQRNAVLKAMYPQKELSPQAVVSEAPRAIAKGSKKMGTVPLVAACLLSVTALLTGLAAIIVLTICEWIVRKCQLHTGIRSDILTRHNER